MKLPESHHKLQQEQEMVRAVPADRSNGYEAVSGEFMARRTGSSVGVATVRQWATTLPPGAAVLDLGCGHGVPISQALFDAGLAVYGIDASPGMIAAFRRRFGNAPAECNAVEDSRLFARPFDGVIAWALMFLLAPGVQASLIHKVSAALNPGGGFLFASPRQICEWSDNLTGQKSVSLGSEAYRQVLEAEGLVLVDCLSFSDSTNAVRRLGVRPTKRATGFDVGPDVLHQLAP